MGIAVHRVSEPARWRRSPARASTRRSSPGGVAVLHCAKHAGAARMGGEVCGAKAGLDRRACVARLLGAIPTTCRDRPRARPMTCSRPGFARQLPYLWGAWASGRRWDWGLPRSRYAATPVVGHTGDGEMLMGMGSSHHRAQSPANLTPSCSFNGLYGERACSQTTRSSARTSSPCAGLRHPGCLRVERLEERTRALRANIAGVTGFRRGAIARRSRRVRCRRSDTMYLRTASGEPRPGAI